MGLYLKSPFYFEKIFKKSYTYNRNITGGFYN